MTARDKLSVIKNNLMAEAFIKPDVVVPRIDTLKEHAMFLTRSQFIHRLICAGWTQEEAESQWRMIEDEPEEDQEGQL